jgi:hypothetical protein
MTHFTPGEIDEAGTIEALRIGGYLGEVVFAEDLMTVTEGPGER